MKKLAYFLIFFIGISILVTAFLGFKYYKENYDIEYVFVKVNKEPKKIEEGYEYSLNSYNENLDSKKIQFIIRRNKSLKYNAYLKIDFSYKKGVISWREIQKNDLNQNIKLKLDTE